MLGSLTESEFVAIEMWFQQLPKEMVASTTNNNNTTTSSSGSPSQICAMVTDGLLKGNVGTSQPLTVANVKSLAPRIYEVGGGLWKFDCRLLDEWISHFPKGSGTLVDVISFLYRDTPRLC